MIIQKYSKILSNAIDSKYMYFDRINQEDLKSLLFFDFVISLSLFKYGKWTKSIIKNKCNYKYSIYIYIFSRCCIDNLKLKKKHIIDTRYQNI